VGEREHGSLGDGDVWVTGYVITNDEQPVHTVSIMEFRAGKVVSETLSFADPFKSPSWRAESGRTDGVN